MVEQLNISPLKSYLKEMDVTGRLHLLAFIAAVILLIATGCGQEPEGERAGIESGSDTTAASTQKRNPTVKSIADTVSRIRGLPLKSEIKVSYIDREQLLAELKAEMEKEYPVEQAQAEEKVLKALGLLDEQANLSEEITRMLGEGVIGFYDDDTKELKIISETPEITPMNEMTLSHEVTHALQDQHFDLLNLVGTGDGTNGDRDLAVMSLVEGEATLVEEEYTTRVLGPVDLASALFESLGVLGGMGDAPPYLQDSLEFPYLSGREFVSFLLEREGWEAVNEAYAHPPQSTEQIMHPEKYLAGEAPAPVEIPDLGPVIGPGWRAVDENTLGEFDVLEILSPNVSLVRAKKAAAGWGGGAFRYGERGDGRPVLVMVFIWDTIVDADEFSTAMGDSLQNRYTKKFDFEQWPAPVMVTGEGTWAVEQRGNMVAVVLAPEELLASRVAGAALGI